VCPAAASRDRGRAAHPALGARKALTPNDFRSLADVEERLLGLQRYYESIATPFEWRFTKDDLAALMQKLDFHASALAAVA
jgi:hypothetical protein